MMQQSSEPQDLWQGQGQATYQNGASPGRRRIVVFAVFALVLVVVILGAVRFWLSQVPVFVVNGTDQAYDVEIGGERKTLASNSHTAMTLSSGSIDVKIVSGPLSGTTDTVQIDMNLLDRVLSNPVLVVNPDQIAIIEWEQQGFYDSSSNSGESDYDFEYVFGKTVHKFDDIDFVFEPFPQQVWVNSSTQVEMRTRVSLPNYLTVEDIASIVQESGDAIVAERYLRTALRIAPDTTEYLDGLHNVLGDAQFMAAIEDRLDDRPVLIETHRSWQEAARAGTPDAELIVRYRQLLADDPENPALMYLLARLLEDSPHAEALFAVAADHPQMTGDRPRHALLYEALSDARFSDTLMHAQLLDEMSGGDDPHFTRHLMDAQIALGQFEDALKTCRRMRAIDSPTIYLELINLSLLQKLGQEDRFDTEIAQYRRSLKQLGFPAHVEQEWVASVVAHRFCLEGDFTSAAAQLTDSPDPYDRFRAAIWMDDLGGAEREMEQLDDFESPLVLAMVAQRNGNAELQQRCLDKAADQLAGFEDSRSAALLATLTNMDEVPFDALAELDWYPLEKALLLTLAGMQRSEIRERCYDLARKLNFHDHFPAWTIRTITDS